MQKSDLGQTFARDCGPTISSLPISAVWCPLPAGDCRPFLGGPGGESAWPARPAGSSALALRRYGWGGTCRGGAHSPGEGLVGLVGLASPSASLCVPSPAPSAPRPVQPSTGRGRPRGSGRDPRCSHVGQKLGLAEARPGPGGKVGLQFSDSSARLPHTSPSPAPWVPEFRLSHCAPERGVGVGGWAGGEGEGPATRGMWSESRPRWDGGRIWFLRPRLPPPQAPPPNFASSCGLAYNWTPPAPQRKYSGGRSGAFKGRGLRLLPAPCAAPREQNRPRSSWNARRTGCW